MAQPADDKKDVGRPSSYRPEYAEQARKLCLLGAIDRELAEFFGVSERTVNSWKDEFPEFLQSIKAGKIKADAIVAHSLFHRAIGYKHDAVKILTVSDGNNQGSHIEQVPYIERYPPDAVAAMFWLKNRRPEMWRDKQEQEHTFPDLTPEDRQNRIASLLAIAKERAKTNGNGQHSSNGNGTHG